MAVDFTEDAAIDFQPDEIDFRPDEDTSSALAPANIKGAYDEGVKPILGAGIRQLNRAGRFLAALGSDIKEFAFGPPTTGKSVIGGIEYEPFRNISAFTEDPDSPLPAQEDLEKEKGVKRFIGKAALGLLEMEPKLAGAILLGGPASLAGAALGTVGRLAAGGVAASLPFSIDEEGTLDVKNAAILSAVPAVGALGGKLTAHILSKYPGITEASAKRVVEGAGGLLTANAYLLATQAPEIMALPPEERETAILDSIAVNLGPSLLGVAEILGGPKEVATIKQEQLKEIAPETAKEVIRTETKEEIKTNQEEVISDKEAPAKQSSLEPPTPVEFKEDITLGIAAPGLEIPISKPDFWKRWFKAEGDLPKEVFDLWREREGFVQEKQRQITYATRDLKSALAEQFQIPAARRAVASFRDVPVETVQQMNQVMKGGDINSLPTRLREPISKMRQEIDQLSSYMIEHGLIDERLQAIVGENFGIYVTRSYRMFDDPKHAESIPPDVFNKARNYLLEESRRNNPEFTEQQADTLLRELIDDWKGNGTAQFMRRTKLGSKDLSLFFKRQDLAPEIRELLGEYQSPIINYAKSITKIARFIGDQEFLNQVKSTGMGKFLFETGTEPPGFNTLIAAEGSSVMSPLNGLRTSPEIAKSFETFGKEQQSNNRLAKIYFGLNALSKGSKTVGSLMTQMRNLTGQPFFNWMSGHFNMFEYGKAIKAIAADVGASNSVKFRDYYKKLVKLGVVNESIYANDLRSLLKDAGLREKEADSFTDRPRILGKAIEGPIRAYQVSDELGKIVGFENELARMKKISPNTPIETLERQAAERIRNTYPTYSMLPESVREFRKQPVFGPFVPFAYEIFRTTFHNFRYIQQDLKSPNLEQKKAGGQRLAGTLGVLSSGLVLAALSKKFWDISKQEEDDLRRFQPPWSKNSQFIFTGKSGTELDFINFSYQNPYSYLTDPLIAVLSTNEEEVFQKSIQAFAEFLRPFVNEQMLFNALVDWKRNKTETGREVYNPQDTWGVKWQKSTSHILESLAPGTVSRLQSRIIPSLTGEQPTFGRELKPTTEITREITGIAKEKFDFKRGLDFKIRSFKQNEANAEAIFSGSILRNQNMMEKYIEADQQRFNLWRELYRDVQAAKRRGVTDVNIRNLLRDANISAADTGRLTRGEYDPQIPTASAREKARRANRELPMLEIRSYIQSQQNKRLD